VTAQVSLRGVSHRFETRGAGVDALGPLDLEIGAGEFVVLVGPSGCGKSTLLSLLAGFLPPSSGSISVDGREIVAPGPGRGVVFQQPNLYPWLSVRDNVALGPRLRGVDRRTRGRIADEHLALVGLTEFARAAPYELSGGMQQRCQIARMLANDPGIMLLDEPFAALDALTREQMQDELHRIWRGSGKTALFITHSVEEAVYLGTRIVVLSPRPGRIVFDEPTPVDAVRTPELRAAPEFVAFRERVRRQLDQRGAQRGADLAHSAA
jgi:ABC-type nitrate/sulfonate/bicarbonate transport system ATPase subunit